MRLIDAIGGGSSRAWPTPLASDGSKGGPNQKGGKGDLRLTSAVHQWPTPTKDAATDRPGRYDQGGMSLSVAARESMFPTPTADDANNVSRASGTFQSLTRAVFPTPRADKTSDESLESWQARQRDGKVSTPPLALAVRMIPTPTAGDAKSSGTRNTENSAAHPGLSLTDFVRQDGGTGRLPTPAARDWKSGKGRKENGHTPQLPEVIEQTAAPSLALNPDWVEILMGWPSGWTKAPRAIGRATGSEESRESHPDTLEEASSPRSDE